MDKKKQLEIQLIVIITQTYGDECYKLEKAKGQLEYVQLKILQKMEKK